MATFARTLVTTTVLTGFLSAITSQTFAGGVTIITHGFEFATPDFGFPSWTLFMADAIQRRAESLGRSAILGKYVPAKHKYYRLIVESNGRTQLMLMMMVLWI